MTSHLVEKGCVECLRRHAPGACPPDGAAPPPVQARDTDALPFGEFLQGVRARAVVVPDAIRADERPPACEACGATRKVRVGRELVCRSCHLCSDVPDSFRWASFSAPELAQRVLRKEAIAEAKQATQKRFVTLTGDTRSGKTSLVAAMFRERAESYSERNVFVLAFRLGLARVLHPLGTGEAPEVLRAIDAHLLVLDDLGLEKNVPTNPVPDIILERHAEGRPTWITTALRRQDLVDRYGGGIARRVLEGVRLIACGPEPS